MHVQLDVAFLMCSGPSLGCPILIQFPPNAFGKAVVGRETGEKEGEKRERGRELSLLLIHSPDGYNIAGKSHKPGPPSAAFPRP